VKSTHRGNREKPGNTGISGAIELPAERQGNNSSSTRSSLSRSLLFALKLSVGLSILYWLITTGRFDIGMYRTLVQPGAIAYALAALMLQSASILLSLARWQLLLKAVGIPLSLAQALRLGCQGTYMGLFLPGTLGVDGLRMLHLKTHYRKHLLAGLASITMDRALGFVGLLILAISFSSLFILERGEGLSPSLILWMIGALLVASMVLAVACGFVPMKGMKLLRRVKHFAGFIDALGSYREFHWTLVLVIGLSIMGNFLVILAACCGLAALGLPFSVLAVATVTPILIVIRFLPLTPMGLGVTDAAAVELYRMVGLSGGAENQMLLRATWIIFVLLCGLSFFGGAKQKQAR
jgi:uncharacterized protein (TIRG00374 family)